MRKWKQIYQTEDYDLQPKFESYELYQDIEHIMCDQQMQKMFLGVYSSVDSLRTYDFKTQAFSNKLKRNAIIKDMKLYTAEKKLFVLENRTILKVFRTDCDQDWRNILLPNYCFDCFVFADKSCETLILNSSITGLLKLNLESKKYKTMDTNIFNTSTDLNFLISSDKKTLYGSLENKLSAAISLNKGFKLKLFSSNGTDEQSLCQTLKKNNKILFSGYFYSKLVVSDTRSRKRIDSMQFAMKNKLHCLQSGENLVFGGTWGGELIVIKDRFPFSVLYYQEINHRIYSICVTESLLIVGGHKKDSLKAFDIQEIESLERSIF